MTANTINYRHPPREWRRKNDSARPSHCLKCGNWNECSSGSHIWCPKTRKSSYRALGSRLEVWGYAAFRLSSNCFTANLNSSLWNLYLPCRTEKKDHFEINLSVEELARFLIGIRWSDQAVKNFMYSKNTELIFLCNISFQYWFQNRRAKSRREGRKVPSECQRNSLDQIGRLPKTSVQPPSNPWIQAEKMSYTEVNKHSAKLNTRSGLILVNHRHLSIKSDQPRCRSPSLVPMLRPYQLKRRLLVPTRPLYSRDFHRYQPY